MSGETRKIEAIYGGAGARSFAYIKGKEGVDKIACKMPQFPGDMPLWEVFMKDGTVVQVFAVSEMYLSKPVTIEQVKKPDLIV